MLDEVVTQVAATVGVSSCLPLNDQDTAVIQRFNIRHYYEALGSIVIKAPCYK
jgi:hypothetical protein